MKDNRIELLKSLLNFDRDLIDLRNELSKYGWDSKEDLVYLARDHLITILRRFLDKNLSEQDVEDWANSIEGREDIGFEEKYEQLLQDCIYELANPILTRPLTYSSAKGWISRLEQPQ